MKVRANVHVRSEDGTKIAVLTPGDEVPDWATVTNPKALEDPSELDEPEVKPARKAPAAK